MKAQSILVTILLGVLLACQKGEDVVEFSGEATGSQVVPTPVASSGIASVTGVYNDESRIFSYRISWDNLADTITRINFRGPSDATITGPVVIEVGIAAKRDSGSIANYTILRDSIGAQLKGGKLYFVIQSKAFPDGELRGQVVPQ